MLYKFDEWQQRLDDSLIIPSVWHTLFARSYLVLGP